MCGETRIGRVIRGRAIVSTTAVVSNRTYSTVTVNKGKGCPDLMIGEQGGYTEGEHGAWMFMRSVPVGVA